MNYKSMSYISGIIIFFSFVLFFGCILWLSGERILSTKEYKVYFKFTDVVGLKDHSAVYMRGYRIGWTKEVEFEGNAVLVRVDVKRRFHIPIDSKIEINTMNFLGEKAITISPGNSTEYLKARGIMAGENKDIIIVAKSILTSLRNKVEEGTFDQAIRQITETIATSRDVVHDISQKVSKIDVESFNMQIKEIGLAAKNLREFAEQSKNDISKLSTEGSASLKDFDQTLLHFSELSTEVTQIAKKLNQGEGSAGEILNNKEYLQNLNTTVLELKLLIEDVKKNPKKYVDLSLF
jgi:phospholipid/cholesterol/gamma-HCH transport system substrate-binding protein